MPIPMIPAGHSEGIRPAVPIEGSHMFRSIPATPSERSDAGSFDILLKNQPPSRFCFFLMEPPFSWMR